MISGNGRHIYVAYFWLESLSAVQLKQAPSCSFPERKKKKKNMSSCSDNEPLDRERHTEDTHDRHTSAAICGLWPVSCNSSEFTDPAVTHRGFYLIM